MNPHQVNRIKILLADSDGPMRSLLKEYLEKLGYEVFSAQNGREAVEVAHREKPDLIILEMILPELDGLEVCRQLKGDASTREIVFLFLTAKDDMDSKVNAFEAGADDYLAKPFSPRELEARLIAALRRHRPELKLPDLKQPAAPADTVQVKRADRKGELVRDALSTKKAKDPFRISGTVLNGKYELTEFAGSGGMGAVYRALSLRDQNIVAVKILQPHIVTRNSEYAELFEREAKNARHLDHPHIVKVFDSGKDEDLSYMVMEWVEGRSVEDVLTQGQLPLDRLTNIFEQICGAVAFAHERNIIHLDLKPGNILLLNHSEPDDFVKVIDFGLSRVISKESGTTVTKFRGTHQFCAPEQFGGKVSHRSDIYSLGATLYYLTTGVIPFGASYINAKIHPNLELPPLPSVVLQRDVAPDVDRVIRKALNKNPALRQQSASQLFQEFHEAISARQTPEEDKPIQMPPTSGRKTKVKLAAATAVALALLTVLGAVVLYQQPKVATVLPTLEGFKGNSQQPNQRLPVARLPSDPHPFIAEVKAQNSLLKVTIGTTLITCTLNNKARRLRYSWTAASGNVYNTGDDHIALYMAPHTPGADIVTLTVTDDMGRTDSESIAIIISPDEPSTNQSNQRP